MKSLLQADLAILGLFKNISPVVMLFSVYLLCPLSACADRVVISSGEEYSVSSVIENELNTSSSSSGYGGAIFNLGTLETTSGAEFNSNQGYMGGAIFNYSNSTATITDTNFSQNSAAGPGGAIYNYTNASLIITNSVFDENKSSQAYGGAVYNAGTAEITGSSFTNNTAYSNGGAIYSSGTASITASTFTSNSGKNGGAILNTGSATITDSAFTSNMVSVSGGAVYNGSSATKLTITNSTFKNNTAKTYGGAIFNAAADTVTAQIENSVFESNSAGYGGAIANYSSSTLAVTDSTFTSNTVSNYGGAVLNMGTATIENSTFTENSASEYGGAVYNHSSGTLTISDSAFTSNTADYGGAIYNSGTLTITDSAFTGNSAVYGGAIWHTGSAAVLAIDNAIFSSNTADQFGGALAIGDSAAELISITNSTFTGNSAGTKGGAIGQSGDSTAAITIENSVFTDNTATGDNSEGGAIAANGTLTVTNSTFTGNKTMSEDSEQSHGGGAIFLFEDSNATITGSTFTNNSSGTYGGAIGMRTTASSDSTSLTVLNSSFSSNTAGIYGGAIAAFVDTVITNSDFTDNSAGEAGGAIYAAANLTINSDGYMSVFSGNSTSAGGDLADNAIYVGDSDATLTFNLTNGGSVYMEDSINGEEGYSVVIEGDDKDSTTFYLLNDIYNANVYFAGTTINTINDAVYVYDFNSLTITGDTNMIADVDLANEEMDRFTADSYGEHSGSLYVTGMNLLSDSEYDSTEIYFAESGLKDYVINAVSSVPDSNQTTVYSPIYKYLVSYENRDDAGYFVFTKYGTSGSTSTSTQNLGYESYNPAIMASPVAAQLGGYLVQLNSYDEAFRNMDMYMLLPKKQRMAMKMKNKYAVNSPVFDISLEREDKNYSAWARPYTTFEKVPLHNGPKVSNVAYGSFFGDESDIIDLGHGWDGVWGIYAGYNGSHQSYDGVGIWQNGGTLGLVGMAYKGNFFTGLTANVGASAGEANSSFGKDDFTMLMAGAASKTGYNFEFADGKFVIQPQLLLSYSFVNTFDYTNASGVHMSSDPLHAIQIEPGVKFIGNLKNGWQPYLGVSFVWNIIDKTHFMANDVSLPNLSIDPYVKYGAGVRKSWGERLVGYFQTYITNGGRNGVGLQAGFKFSLGKTNSPKPSMRKSPTIGELPELKKTDFRLNYIK